MCIRDSTWPSCTTMTPHSRRRHPTSSATELDGPRRSLVRRRRAHLDVGRLGAGPMTSKYLLLVDKGTPQNRRSGSAGYPRAGRCGLGWSYLLAVAVPGHDVEGRADLVSGVVHRDRLCPLVSPVVDRQLVVVGPAVVRRGQG